MLARNTVVSCGVFALGLVLMWLLVERRGMNQTIAAGVSFLAGNTLHYLIGRTWIFRGTRRPFGSGLAYFLINAGIGLVITLALFEALVSWTPIHYLAARIIVSLIAGLAMFYLNAVLNFRRV